MLELYCTVRRTKTSSAKCRHYAAIHLNWKLTLLLN